MFRQLFLFSQLTLHVFAGEFTFNQFVNPPAEPAADPSNANTVVVFNEGDTQNIKWITTFKKSSLALLPIGADPLGSKSTAEFITRNVTSKSVQWPVAPPSGQKPGVFFFQLYQEGEGDGNFGSHTFAINGGTTSTTSTPPPAIASSTSIGTFSIIPIASSTSSIDAVPTTTAVPAVQSVPIILSSSALPTIPAVQTTPTISSSSVLPTTTPLAFTSTSSVAVESTTFSTSIPTPGVSSLNTPSTITSPTILTPTSSPTSSLKTSSTAISPSFPNTQNETTNSKKLNTTNELLVIIIPISVVFLAVVAFFVYRFVGSRRGVEAIMKKSMKVQEMPQDALGTRWRDTAVLDQRDPFTTKSLG